MTDLNVVKADALLAAGVTTRGCGIAERVAQKEAAQRRTATAMLALLADEQS